MTIAEQLQAMGEEKGQIQGREEVAVNLLKEGADARFVARITELELVVILKLKE